MSNDGKAVALPRGWPNGDWCPPTSVIDRMTHAEVSRLIADVQHELDFLKAWNERRGKWTPLPDFFEGAPPPKSRDEYNWNVRQRR